MLRESAPVRARVKPERPFGEDDFAAAVPKLCGDASRDFNIGANRELSSRGRSLAPILVGIEFLSFIDGGLDVFLAHDSLARSLKSRPFGGLAIRIFRPSAHHLVAAARAAS